MFAAGVRVTLPLSLLLAGIAPGGCGTGCKESNCGGTADLLNACRAGSGCDLAGQAVECSPKTGYVNEAVGYCQIEVVDRGEVLTIDLAGFDLGRRNDVVFRHGTGLRFEDGVDFEGANVEVEGADVPCLVENHQVSCRDLPPTAKKLRLRSDRRNLRFVTVTSTDAQCEESSPVCPR